MATANKLVQVSIDFRLSEDEALYLLGVLQNSLTVDESPADNRARTDIWHALKEAQRS